MKNRLLCIILLTFIILLIPFSFAKSIAKEEEKIIYLTFDDGPSDTVLKETLDILKKEEVKGTFFVIGKEIRGREDILKEVVNEGHALGLHSFSHERNNLYSSNEAFLEEMLKTQNIINEVTNLSPTILRFPFGANNNTYKLTSSMVDLLHKNNLKIYDWNVDSGDGEFPLSSPDFFIKKSKSNKNNIILLMHCGNINKNSPKALPEIIKYYKEKGYTFKSINNTTPECFHFLK